MNYQIQNLNHMMTKHSSCHMVHNFLLYPIVQTTLGIPLLNLLFQSPTGSHDLQAFTGSILRVCESLIIWALYLYICTPFLSRTRTLALKYTNRNMISSRYIFDLNPYPDRPTSFSPLYLVQYNWMVDKYFNGLFFTFNVVIIFYQMANGSGEPSRLI